MFLDSRMAEIAISRCIPNSDAHYGYEIRLSKDLDLPDLRCLASGARTHAAETERQ